MTDRELTHKAIRDNHSDFAAIVHRYSGMVFSKALDLMQTKEGAAEVTQQTFVLAFENINTWHGIELEPWLSTIVEQTAFKILNEEHDRHTISLESLPVSELDALINETTDSEMHEARFRQLDAAIATLTKLDQQILYLKYHEDMGFEDIARCTGLTKNYVHVRLYRIRVRLKSILIHGRQFRHQPCRLIHDKQECYEATG